MLRTVLGKYLISREAGGRRAFQLEKRTDISQWRPTTVPVWHVERCGVITTSLIKYKHGPFAAGCHGAGSMAAIVISSVIMNFACYGACDEQDTLMGSMYDGRPRISAAFEL